MVRVRRRTYIANKRKSDPTTFIALCRELKDASNWVKKCISISIQCTIRTLFNVTLKNVALALKSP